MKKIVNFLHKLNTPLFYAILSAVFGLAFLLLPVAVLDVLLVIVGITVTLAALVLLSDIDSSVRDTSYYLSLVKGVAILIFGIVTAIARSALSRMLASSLGLYILIKALPTLVRLIVTTEPRGARWWKDIIICAVEVLLGLWMTVYPIYPKILTGIILIVLSIDTFISLKSGSSDSDDGYYEADFEDKS